MDGITIVGNQVIGGESRPVAGPPEKAPTAQEQAKLDAEKLMADKSQGYFDRSHPKHKETNARVKLLMEQHSGNAPPWDGVTLVESEPQPTPPAKSTAPLPKPAAPASSTDPRAQVPARAEDYDLQLGTPPPGIEWTPSAVRIAKQALHKANATRGQAASIVSLIVGTVIPAVQARGLEALDDKMAEAFEYRLKALGMRYGQAEIIDDGLQ